MSLPTDGTGVGHGQQLLELIRNLAATHRSQVGGGTGVRDDDRRHRIKDLVLRSFFTAGSPEGKNARELVGLYVEDCLLGVASLQARKPPPVDLVDPKEDRARHVVDSKRAGGAEMQPPDSSSPKADVANATSPAPVVGPERVESSNDAVGPLGQASKAASSRPSSQGDAAIATNVQLASQSKGGLFDRTKAAVKRAIPAGSSITHKAVHSCKPGRLNVPYSEPLPDWVSQMRERAVDGLPDGIRMSADAASLEGVPTIHGEIKAMIKGRTQDGTPIELTLHVPILPDPKALWKNLPSDPNGKFAKPDVDGEGFEDKRLGVQLLAASVRGRSHAQKGTYRDDDYLVRCCPSGWVIVATADGAGSAEFSRQGSHLAVKHASEELENRLRGTQAELEEAAGDEDRIRSLAGPCMFAAVRDAVAAIERVAAGEGLPDTKFSTTLILIAARPYGERWLVLSFGIGDGGAAIWNDRTKTVIPLTKGDSGEFAGQTRFLRRNEVESLELVLERTKAVLVERPTAILSMTDGITDPKFETDSLFESAEHWQGFWRNDFAPMLNAVGDAGSKERLLAWMEFWSPGNHDDRTLAALLFDSRS